MAGAPRPDDLAGALRDAGFEHVVIEQKNESREFIKDWLPGSGAEDYVVSANVTAVRPGGGASLAEGHTPAEASLASAGAEAAALVAKRSSSARARWAAQVGAEAPAAPALPPGKQCCAPPRAEEAAFEEQVQKAAAGKQC